MKKKLLGLLLIAVMTFSLVCTVFADTLKGGEGWYVNFTGKNPLDTNFTSTDMTDAASEMEPGDNITFTVKVQNTKEQGQAVNYYLKNQILKSFEEGEAEGAAYAYKLSYTSPSGTTSVFYDNTAVGGTSGDGLVDVNDVLNGEYFYLDQLDYGKEGTVTLYVELDGETQGNDYFTTMAKLDLQFMVEEVESKPDEKVVEETSVGEDKIVNVPETTTQAATTGSNTNTTTAKTPISTGDRSNLLPLWICFGVAGVVLIVFAIILIKRRKQNDDEGQE